MDTIQQMVIAGTERMDIIWDPDLPIQASSQQTAVS